LKLLFDANLSPKLVRRLTELFPDSAHVFGTGLEKSTLDEAIWAKTTVVEELLRRNAIRIADLEQSDRPVLIIRNAKSPE
jgi:predicted nuclease of predicted toxin-antitoxin system